MSISISLGSPHQQWAVCIHTHFCLFLSPPFILTPHYSFVFVHTIAHYSLHESTFTHPWLQPHQTPAHFIQKNSHGLLPLPSSLAMSECMPDELMWPCWCACSGRVVVSRSVGIAFAVPQGGLHSRHWL